MSSLFSGGSMASINKFASEWAIGPQAGIGASRLEGAEHDSSSWSRERNRADATGSGGCRRRNMARYLSVFLDAAATAEWQHRRLRSLATRLHSHLVG